MSKNKLAFLFAILAAALYAINVPFSKLLLERVSPTMLAGFLYLGAGAGMGLFMGGKKLFRVHGTAPLLGKEDLPYTIAMVVLDIAAPIFLMFGIANSNSANVSLLNNFEIAATSLIAFVVFKENISKKLWVAIALVLGAGILLSFEGAEAFSFQPGSVWVLCACLCWGIENNCTRSISGKSSEQIVLIKGIFSGMGSLAVALCLKESLPHWKDVLFVMLLGFVSYGLSINFYILAQKCLGAAKTSAFYSIAPFLGVGFSFLLLGERPGLQFYLALVIMLFSTYLIMKDTLGRESLYGGYVHSHSHRHGDTVHTHEHRHFIYNPMHIHSHSHEV